MLKTPKNSNTANTCAAGWALKRLNHKRTIFTGTVSCFQQSCLLLWKTQPTVKVEPCPAFPTLWTLPWLQSRNLLHGIFNLICSMPQHWVWLFPDSLLCLTSCSLPGQPNTSSQDHLFLIIPFQPFPLCCLHCCRSDKHFWKSSWQGKLSDPISRLNYFIYHWLQPTTIYRVLL